MTTTDSNGLIQYQTTDNVVPLQTAFNGLSSSVSTALNSTVRTFKVASDAERNALATSRPPTASNPLLVFNSASGKGYHEINTGSGWSRFGWSDTGWLPGSGLSVNSAYISRSRIQYRILNGVVYWRGQFSSAGATLGDNAVISNLPSSIRPAAVSPLSVSVDGSSQVSLVVNPAGELRVYGGTSNSWPVFGGSYSLN